MLGGFSDLAATGLILVGLIGIAINFARLTRAPTPPLGDSQPRSRGTPVKPRRTLDGFACALEFDTSSTDFVRGVELGRLWEIVKQNPDQPVEEFVHASNAEMVLRIADATGRQVQSEELDDTWLLVTFV